MVAAWAVIAPLISLVAVATTASTATANDCVIGSTQACPGASAKHIKDVTGTNTDGVYWITVAGVSTQVYSIMNSAMDGGGWMLAMKGANTGSTFNYASSYWTTSNTLNTNLNRRNDTNNEDAKFSVFNSTQAAKVLAIFPDATAGGAITGQSYGFTWNETMPTPANTQSYSGRPVQGDYTGKTLRELFAGGEKIYIRDATSASPYRAVGTGVFSTQTDVRFFGFNYSGGSPSKARFGVAFNENSSGAAYPVANEGSNDVEGGIGLSRSNTSAGDFIYCCQNSTGVNRQMKFELYVKAYSTIPDAPTSFTATPANTQVTLNWAAASATSPVTGYTVQSSSNGGSTWSTAVSLDSAALSYTYSGLINGTSYSFRVNAINALGAGLFSTVTAIPSLPPDAPTINSLTVRSGAVCAANANPSTGVTAAMVGNDCVVRFTNPGTTTWTPPAGITNVRGLVVAGGGGGGNDLSGGGGAGGVVKFTTLPVSGSPTISVTVGAGGAGAPAGTGPAGSSGGNSSLTGTGIALVARGGGFGASAHNVSTYPAASGGSGGGGSGGRAASTSYGGVNGLGTQSTQTQLPTLGSIGGAHYGNDGANSGTTWYPGGGGGAGAAATQSNTIGHGGIGIEDNILGTSYYWGGGGGAAGYSGNAGNGGLGGGGGGSGQDGSRGAGGSGLNPGSAGVGGRDARGGNAGANTGGGGGGGSHFNANNNGGDGGSGIVVLRYEALSVYVEANLTAPASNGGSALTNYLYQYSTDGSTWSTAASSGSTATTFNLVGPTPGSNAYIRIAAKNPAGTSAYVQYPSALLVAAVPSAPTSLVATRGNNQVSLSWTAPTANGGAAISDYVIGYSTDNTNWSNFTDAVSATASAVVTGLVNGTPYYFRVSAVNAAGASTYLLSSSTTTPATTPSAPPSLTVSSVSGGSISTTGLVGYWNFDASSSLGVNSVAGNTALTAGGTPTYTASGKNGGGLLLNGSSYLAGTVANLPTGSTNYTIGGWIKNTSLGGQGIIGWGNWGSTNQTNALRTASDSLYNYWWGNDLNSGMPAGKTLLNSWRHVIATYDGTTRKIYLDGALIASGNTSGLNAQNMNFRIGSTNSSENFIGTLDDMVIYNRALTLAEVGTLMNQTAGQATLTWSDMSSTALNGGAAISSYTVDYSTDNVNWTNSVAGASTATSATVTGLISGTSYFFRVRANNAAGNGVYATTGPRLIANAATLTYNGNSNATGTVPTDSTTYQVEGTVSVLGNTGTLARPGYTFAGWTDNSGGTGTVYAAGSNFTLPSASSNLYAKWTPNSNTVTYTTQGGSVVSSVTWNTAASLTLPAAPTRAGYTFNGWYDAATSGTRVGSASASYTPTNTESFTLFAQWTANSNGVTFNSQGGSTVASQNWTTGTSLTLPAAPTRAGYTFNGWYDAATSGTRVGSGTTSKNGLHFDGVDDLVTVSHAASFNFTNTVTIEAWINTTSTSEQYITTKGESSFYLGTNLSGGSGKANFWLNGVSNVSGGWLHSSATVNDGNWHHIAGTYDGSTLKLYVDGVLSASRSVAATIQTGSTSVNIGSRGGGAKFNGKMYELRFWNVARSSEEIVASMNSTLTGSENGLVANYTFNQGSAGASNAGLTTAISSTNTNNGTLSGFALTGATSNWIEAVSGISSYSPANTAAFTIFAQWSANVNALTFETQGGSAVSSTTFTTGSSITLPAAPILAGSTFNGWYLAASGGSSIGAANATYSPVATSALIIYAQWTTTRAISIDSATYLASYALTATTKPTLVATTTAGASSGTITFTSATTSICTVNSTTGLVAFVAIGTCSISAAITAAGGFAAATSPSISFAIRAIPGAPTSPTALVGNQQVVVSWVAPTNAGGGVTSYIVTASPGGATCTWTSGPLTCVVTGLANGTAYTFSVVSANSQGNSASATSASVTPRTVPGAPTITTVTQSSSGAAVAFTAPASNGGSAITSYTVTASNGATATGSSSPITITGLSLGVPYSFTVIATNAAGASVSSTPSNTETLRGPPGAPSAPTATQLPSGANVVWSAPSANGAEITDFLIQYSSNSGSTWTTFSDETSTATVATIGGLTNGTSYLFRVAAVNAQGTGSYSAASAAFTPAAPPDAPGKPTGSANGTTIEVSWSAPASSNGSAISDYQIFYSQNNGSTWAQLPRTVSTSTAATVSGLSAGNIYLFKAHAVNARGISLSSEVSLPVAIGTVPNAPTTLIAQVDSPTTSVVLTWKKPAGGVGAVAAAPVAAPAADFTPGLLGKRYVNYYNDNFAWFNTAQLFQGTGTPQNSNAIFNFSSNSDFYSWMWTGFFKAPTTGVYRFYTMSDDASHLWIGDAATSGYNASNAVVNNGGLHPPQTRSGMISLVAGVYYPIRIMFGEYGGGDVLSVYWDLPNGTRVTNGTGYFFQSATGTFASAPKGCAGSVGNSAGVQITNENGKCVLRFTNPGANSWKVPAGVSNVDVLVVGAGGGAGFDAAGGGGGGSVIEQLSYSVTANSTIQVQVGNGGATSQVVGGQAEDGQNSLFDSLAAPGGGGGGSKNSNGRAVSSASGGGSGHANGGSTSGGSNASSATSFAGWKASSPSMVNIQGTLVQFSYMRGSATNTFTIARNVTTGVRFDVEVDNSINNIIGWRGEKIDTYGMQIELLNTSGAVVARNSIDLTTKHGLLLKNITANYTGFVQSVRLTVSGIDTGFWAGWYGPIFRNPSFYIDGSIFGASATVTGFSGGSSPGNAPGHRGGGGGGAAAVGQSSTTGNGGAGKISAITGTYFGGGGAGGSYVTNGGIGGVGGGGNGGNGSGSTCGNDGVANTGGGGGSMGNAGCGNRSLGRGATGVVILRYNAEVATVELPPPSDYVIQYSVDSPTVWSTFNDGTSSSESATVTNLTPGLNYIFRVASRNGVGDSPYSVTSNAVAIRGAPVTAPGITSVVAGNGTASVTFTAPATTGGSPISRYVATATASGSPAIPARTCTWTTGALNCVISELVNGRTYTVKVVAINSFGNSPESSGSNVTPRTVSSAPDSLTATAGNASVRLSWTAPVNNGGVAITGYRIESSTASSGIWSTVVADTSSIATSETITSLVNGTTYKFRVSAINAAGVSVASREVNALPIGAPSTPAAPTAGVGNGQIFLSWSAPANNGAPITDYEIQYSTSSSGPWTTFSESVTSVTATSITGLTNGTSYYFQIRAINAAGNSSWSASSAAAVPATTPSAPSMDTITATASGTVSIAFTAGANGGASITGYQYSVNDGATWDNLSGTTSPLTVSDLINGVTYQIKIRAVNSQGSGAASGQLSVTPAAAPAAPLISGVVASDTSLAISFSAPANNGGAVVTRYEYQIKASIGAAWSASVVADSPINISNLTNGVGYYIRVRAVNIIGGGDWSATVTGMPFTSPSAPTISQITPGANQLTFAYTVADNGSAITASEYSLDSGNTWIRIPSSASPLTIVGLLNGTAYTPMLRLVNSAGAGSATTASSSTPRTVPSAPQINSVTSGATSLTLALSINNGGAAVSNVAYRYRSVSAAGITSCSASYSTLNWLENWIDWVEVGFTENLTIAGLSNTNCYDVQVRARNIAGNGSSSRESGRPVSVPTAPTITGLVSGNSSIGVTFTETADNGGTALTRYEYRLGSGAWVSLSTDPDFVFGSSTFYRINGLTNGNNYSISMRAVNTAGNGAVSNSLSATPMTTPGVPVISAVTPLDGALRVTFTAPESNGGSAITSYDYSIQSNVWVSITPSTNSFDINGLENGTAYSITLRANNSRGVGTATTLSGPHTPGTAPASPVIAGTIIGNQTISLILTPGLDGGYPLSYYSYSINGGAWVALEAQQLANPLILGPATVALTNGTTYRFAVRAHNAIGASAPSAEVSAAPATTASAPVISAITAADNSLQVAFTAPVTNGGSAITSYQFSLNGGTTWSNFANGAGTSSPLTITGLSNGVNYSVKLRAVNTIAAGAASIGMTGIPQIPGAGRASTVQSSVANQSVTITWAPPTAYVGAPISGYRVTATPGGATCLWVSGPYQCTISGLTNGTPYTFIVTSTWDDSGVSRDIDTTVATAAITPRTIASAPTAVTAVGGANQATLSWSAPANNGGAAITDYNFEFSSDDGASWSSYVDGVSSALSGTVAGLRPGTQYRFRVAAVNAAGISTFSEVTSAAKTFEQATELTLTLDQQTADGFSFILSFNDPLLFTIATSSNNPNAVIEQIGDYYTVKGLSPGAIATVTVTANRTDYLQALATIFSSALLAANAPSISTATSIDGGFSFTIPNYTANSALGITYSVSTTVGAVIDDGSGAYRVVGLANGEASMATISATQPGYVTRSTTLSGAALALGVPAQISDLTSTRDGFTFVIANFDPAMNYETFTATSAARVSRVDGTVTVTGLANLQNASVTIKSTRTGYMDASVEVVGIALPQSEVNTLESIALSSGTITFDRETNQYSLDVANSVSSVTLTPIKTDFDSTISILQSGESPVAINSGSTSTAIPLAVGLNTVTLNVTSQVGATRSYQLNLTRGKSSTSTLSALVLSAGTINGFTSSLNEYESSVGYLSDSITVTSTATQSNATIRVKVNSGNFAAVNTAVASQSLPLNVGTNVVTVEVTAQNGISTSTYVITVTRSGAASSQLGALTTSAGSLNSFSSSVLNYEIIVPSGTTEITLTPTLATGTSGTIAVNGVDLTSGATSQAISIAGSSNTVITILVSASDGSSVTPYQVNVKVDAPPSALTISRASVGGKSGAQFTTQPQITVVDASANRVFLNTATITASISSGAILSGTTTATAVRGLATFNNLGVSGTAGRTYQITYSSGGLVVAQESMTVTAGDVVGLSISAGSTSVASGSVLTTPLQINAVDAQGNTATTFGGVISIAISTGGALSGVVSKSASNGVAVFTDLVLRGTSGSSYTLTVSAPGLVSATRNISLTFGTAASLRVSRSISGAVSGSVFTTTPQLSVRDGAAADSNIVTTSNAIVTVAISSGVGGTLIGSTTATAVNGVATFTGLGLSGVAGTTYTLAYSTDGLVSATESITMLPGIPAKIALTRSAVGFKNGSAFTSVQPQLQIQDATGNLITNSTVTVTATVSSGGVLLGSTSQIANNGIATFTNLGIFGTAGSTYTITFASPGLTSITQTILVASGASLVPSFGSTTPTADGFTAQISNFNRIFNWTLSVVDGPVGTKVALSPTGLLTVTGIGSGSAASISATTSRTGFDLGVSVIAGNSLLVISKPTFGAVTTLSSGFRSQVNNYDSTYQWDISASNGGTASISSSGLITVIGLEPGAESDVTVTVSRTGWVTASASLSGSAAGADLSNGTQDIAANLLSGKTLTGVCAGGSPSSEGIANINDRNSKSKFLCYNATSRNNASYIRDSAGFYTGDLGSVILSGVQFTSGDSNSSRDPIIYSLFGCLSENNNCVPIVVNGRTGISAARNVTGSEQSFRNMTPFNYYKITFGALRSSWTDASQMAEVRFIGAAANASGLIPTFSSETRTANGFLRQINNFDPQYTWRATANNGASATISGSGLITVTGLVPGGSATVAVTTTRTRFEMGVGATSGSALLGALLPTFGVASPSDGGFTVDITNYSDAFTWSASIETGTATITGGRLVVTGQSAGSNIATTVSTTRANYADGRAQVISTSLTTGLTPQFGAISSQSSGFTFQISNYAPTFTWAVSTNAGSAVISNTGLVTITGLATGGGATVVVSTSRTGYFTVFSQITGSSEMGAALTPRFALSTSTTDGFTVQILNYNSAYTWSGTSTSGYGISISGTGLVTVTGVPTGVMASINILTQRTGFASAVANVAATAITPDNEVIVGQDIQLIVPVSASNSPTSVEVVIDIPVDAAPTSTSFSGAAVATDAVDSGLRTVRLDGSLGGNAVTTVSTPIVLTIPASAGVGVPVYSPDGLVWLELSLLAQAELPVGQEMGYYRYEDGTVLIFTRKIGS